MKNARVVASFIVFSFLFLNCQNRNYDGFFENEKLRLTDAAKEVIEKLGLENFEIFAYAHKSISNKIISKNINDTKYPGDYFEPEKPVDRIQQRTIAANYDPNAKNEIMYDNISIIIIFENISSSKKQELLKILDSYIINIERGDNISIVSKFEFDKLE